MRLRVACCILAILWLTGAGLQLMSFAQEVLVQAEQATNDKPPPDDGSSVPLADYQADLTRMQALVAACKADPAACDTAKVLKDETVSTGARHFAVNFDWLREVMKKSHDPDEAERDDLLHKATTRLEQDAAEAAGTSDRSQSLAAAQRKTADVLNRREFRLIQQNDYLQQRIAAAALWLDRFFARAAGNASWIWPLIEWSVLGLTLVGLLLGLWSLSRQQRLEIAHARVGDTAIWQKESDDWAARADEEAARQQWRDAVHCLYWSAIVMLEGRKFWRQNRARTPREYLLLLEEGSNRQHALTGLTRIFERIWYGLRPAGESDYRHARTLLDELRSA